MSLQITSPAFQQGGMIPARYTCDSSDVSPELHWEGAPAGTKSFALVCDDPDAPRGTWVHWVIFNIPPSQTSLRENVPPDAQLADGTRQGTTDFRRTGYGGPCPPSGVHRYFFKLYALDAMLDLKAGSTKAELMTAMEGHILAEAELMGKYSRQ